MLQQNLVLTVAVGDRARGRTSKFLKDYRATGETEVRTHPKKTLDTIDGVSGQVGGEKIAISGFKVQ